MNFWKSYGAHLLGYAAAAVGIVETITPATVAQFPQLAPLQPYVGPAGIVALVATAAGIGVHNAQAAGATSSTAAKAIAPLLAIGMMLGLVGCATVESFIGSPASAPYIEAAVDVAVATAESKGVPAAQINSIAKQALAADSSPTATLAAVAGIVNADIAKLNLPAGDLAAANILEAAVEAAIASKVGTNASLASAQAAAATVLQDVITATGG